MGTKRKTGDSLRLNAGPMSHLQHPEALIFLFGGLWGALLNWVSSVLLFRYAGFNPLVAFFLGTLLNEAFHHFYYRVVYANHEIQFKTSSSLHMFLYVAVAFGGVILLSSFLNIFHWPFEAAVLASIVSLSMANGLFVRISTFGSSKLAEVEYSEMNESFYDDHTDQAKVSKLRAWYHRSRYEKLTQLVLSQYKQGMKVADLGCGNCWWNTTGIPVYGVDINEKMLKWAKRNGRLKAFKVSDELSKTGMPTHSQDLVVMSEVLEHMIEYEPVLTEVKRILKPGGRFLMTVPYDYFLGPFFILFNLNCLYMGYVKGSLYHKYRCGHINHFTKSRLKDTLQKDGFELNDLQVVNGLLLYGVARRVKK